jgi:glyoxylase-like metal-dependent hydrolase (beta-lactamase superfamily II)
MVNGVVQVTEPHVAPLLRSNIWMVGGRSRDLVIDAGLGLVPLRPFLTDDLSRQMVLFASHAHRDHIGAAHEFTDICAHPLEAADIAEARDNISLDVEDWPFGLLQSFEQKGYQCRCGMLSAVPFKGFRPADEHLKPARVSRLVDEGDEIDLGDRCYEVLHLPGHSPGSIGLIHRASGALFAGDAVYDGPLLYDIEGSDRQAYRSTMERLLQLPIELVYPGHGAPFGRTRLHEIAKHYLGLWEQSE